MSRRARERENARPWQQERDDEHDQPEEYPELEPEHTYKPDQS